ncbi:MAG: hypothetical protein ABJH08_04315 [Balneola sp.]
MSEVYYRNSILDYLKSMSDSKKQSEIGAVEAFCIWFDDLYYPCFDSSVYNDGVYEEGLEIFRSCFSEEELKAMSNYHNFIDSIVDEFVVERDWPEILNDPNWEQLTEEAKIAVNAFNQS